MDVDLEASFGLCQALLWRCTLLYECHFQACKAHNIFPALFSGKQGAPRLYVSIFGYYVRG